MKQKNFLNSNINYQYEIIEIKIFVKNNNIEILNINYISKSEINIKIYKSDYDKVVELKTIYEIDIIDYFGIARFKNNILNNKLIIILIFIALFLIYTTTNIIFSVDIITNDSKMEEILKTFTNNK